MKHFALLLALLVLLTACAEVPPPADTAPPLTTSQVEHTIPTETSLPPETTTPIETASMSLITDFSEYEALLDPSGDERNWLFFALGCIFESPEEIDLDSLFYLGLNHGSWDAISADSEEYLIANGFWREMDLQPMPAAELETILQDNFGVSLSDCRIPEEWCYLEAEDFYCANHNDAYFPSPAQITAVEDDGVNIRIFYHAEFVYNSETDEYLDDADMIYCLQRQEDGSIHAISHLPAA